MTKFTTRPATLTAAQAARLLNGGKGVREVVVNGQVVGHYARNKYGVTIGHFDPLALTADENPFVAARSSHSVEPGHGKRGNGRTARDVAADIARQPVGEWEAKIAAAIAARKAA